MQKMIVGLIIAALGAGGFVYAMGQLLTVFGNTSEIGWGTMYESNINTGVIVGLLSVGLFVVGLMLIVSDTDVGI